VNAILLADDEPAVRRLVRTILETALDHPILEAADGAQALALARAERPAVAILDVQMPGLTGFEVCRALRTDPSTQGIRTVILTGAFEAEVQGYACLAGVDRFFTKPVRPAVLLAAVKELLPA
jgi:CheY-like chemotaxis protein